MLLAVGLTDFDWKIVGNRGVCRPVGDVSLARLFEVALHVGE